MNFLHRFFRPPRTGLPLRSGAVSENSKTLLLYARLRLATEFSSKTRVGEAFRNLENAPFALGKAFENSKTFLLRWGRLSKSRKRSFYVGEGFRNLENASFALGKAFEISKTFPLRWGRLSKSRKRFFYVWEAFRKLENASFTLGKAFENSKMFILRWGRLSKSRTASFARGRLLPFPPVADDAQKFVNSFIYQSL